jgi:hypothetical protein
MEKPTIIAKDVVEDLKAGMTDGELMEKYRLTTKGLSSLFRKLVEAGLMSRGDVTLRMSTWLDTVAIELNSLKLGDSRD